MHEYGGLVALNGVSDTDGARQDELDVLQPMSGFQVRQPQHKQVGKINNAHRQI